jgi:alkane 1-monooxygenase
MNFIKYLAPLSIYFLAFVGFTNTGIWCWLAILYSFVFIPSLELLIQPNTKNMTAIEEDVAKQNPWYDYVLYLIAFIQIPILFFFLYKMDDKSLATIDIVGRVLTMGLLCGTFGINVGHELGHRVNSFEQFLAKTLLLSSLYMHFFIEHNKGHHKHVATPQDPSSARKGEMIYAFYFRTIIYSYLSAWKIANEEYIKQHNKLFILQNSMVQIHIIQLSFIGIIFYFFGLIVGSYFLLAAFIGILLLETVNYIEHYGLSRKLVGEEKYERAMPQHSWNSDHIIGRLMLFELSRHSDHHYLASRKYQILRHHNTSPQMPTGYPGMMLLSLVPPLWFFVMNKQMKKFEEGLMIAD